MNEAERIRLRAARDDERCRYCGHRRGAHQAGIGACSASLSAVPAFAGHRCGCWRFKLDPKSRSKPNREPLGKQAVLDGMAAARGVDTPPLEVESPSLDDS